MDFVAIDFETANNNRVSACEVGLVRVRADEIENQLHTLIKPPTQHFSARNVSIHGITASKTADAPTYPEIWPQIRDFTENLPFVAHYAAFDMSVMKQCLNHYCIPWPNLESVCTCEMARTLLPGLKNHKLATLCGLFGIHIKHHKALADAYACAKIAIRLGRMAQGISSFVKEIDEKQRDDESIIPMVSISLDDLPYESEDVPVDPVNIGETDGRFEGMRFVFTGELGPLERSEAEAIVEKQGAETKRSMSRKVDVLVVGNNLMSAYKETGHTTNKLSRALEIKEKISGIKIIDESEFLKMIG